MPTYTRSQFKADINRRIHNKIGVLSNSEDTMNDAVRELRSLKLRSSKRRTLLSPNLFNEIYQYAAPSDLDAHSIIGIQAQTLERGRDENWELTSEEDFDRRKVADSGLIAFSSRDLTKRLLVSKQVDDDQVIAAALDTVTGDGGTWALFGDGTNVAANSSNFVKGSGSVSWDISAAGGTTAGIQNTGVTQFDITDFYSEGSVFVWQYIVSATNLTNFKLRIGSDSSNYYEMTATTTHEGSAFVAGWNLLRFDFSGKTTTGTPSITACDYLVLYMTKTAGKVSETGYLTDHIILKRGQYMYVLYYSRYLWQSSAGTYKENSTADTDYLNLESDEYQLALEKGVEIAGREVREYDDADTAERKFKEKRKGYQSANPDESLAMVTEMYHL